MKLSYIINTCSGDPFARSSRHRQHADRDTLLTTRILPAAEGFDEIIIAGQYHDGPGYTYEPCEPLRRDRRDALWQREIGARCSTGDVLVFGHDDHACGAGFAATLRRGYLNEAMSPAAPHWDILVPRRVHGITGDEMENGRSSEYMGGHILVMKRWLWARVPWTSVDTEWWDVTMTRLWREAGATILFADDIEHIDLEATVDER